jgi:hypothetical protein
MAVITGFIFEFVPEYAEEEYEARDRSTLALLTNDINRPTVTGVMEECQPAETENASFVCFR